MRLSAYREDHMARQYEPTASDLHGSLTPEGNVKAEPGTLYEWHDAGQGAAYVKADGAVTTGWKRVLVE